MSPPPSISSSSAVTVSSFPGRDQDLALDLLRRHQAHVRLSMNPKAPIPGVSSSPADNSWLHRPDLLSVLHYVHEEALDRSFTGRKHLIPLWFAAVLVPMISGQWALLGALLPAAAVLTGYGFYRRNTIVLSAAAAQRLEELATAHPDFRQAMRFATGDQPQVTLSAAIRLITVLRAARG